MVSLRRDSNGNFIARKRLPDDVREEYGRLYGARFEAKFSARASLGKQVAQQKFHQWATEVEQRIEAIRKAQRGEGLDLSREQAAALAGEWYLWFVARYEGDASDPVAYAEALWDIVDAMRDFAPDEVREHPRMYSDWERDPEVRKGIRPVLADMGHTTQFLASRGIALTNNAHALFLDFALDNYIQALLLLQRRARGDYEPDELPKSFSKFAPQRQRTATGLSPRELFDAWVKARQPAPGTIESWSVVFNALTQDFPNRPEHERLAQQVERDLIAHRCANPLKIEAAPCHFAGVVSRQTSSANIRSCSVDRACRRDAYVSHKRCTAITAASHASMFAIGIRAGDSIEIGVAFQ